MGSSERLQAAVASSLGTSLGGDVVKRLLLIFAVLALVVAACGGDTADTEQFGDDASGTEQAQPGEGAGEGEEPDAETTPSVPAGSGEEGELTLNDFIPGFNPTDFEEQDWRAEEMRVQQMVAECMAAEGFEYIPFVPSDIGGGFGYEEWDEETYVREYGFGIASWVLEEENSVYEEESDPWADDPNQEIVEAMDEAEREEYYRLLHGSEPEIIMNTPWEEIEAMTPEEQEAFYDEAYANWEPDGCFNEAYETIYSHGEADAFFEEFGDDLDAFYERAQSDPRIVSAQNEWSACMADKGHDYATQEEMYSYFYGDEFGEGEFSQRVNELITWPEPDPSLLEDMEEGEEPEFDPSLYGPQYDIELLQPLIDEEIAVATANYECSQGMNETWEEIYRDLERQFIEQNMDRLLAFQEGSS